MKIRLLAAIFTSIYCIYQSFCVDMGPFLGRFAYIFRGPKSHSSHIVNTTPFGNFFLHLPNNFLFWKCPADTCLHPGYQCPHQEILKFDENKWCLFFLSSSSHWPDPLVDIKCVWSAELTSPNVWVADWIHIMSHFDLCSGAFGLTDLYENIHEPTSQAGWNNQSHSYHW